jgi:TonB family protein
MKVRIVIGRTIALIATAAMLWTMFSRSLVSQTNGEMPRVVLTKLLAPAYPPIARQARIEGDVHLKISVHSDGSVESVTPIDGPPLLVQAAVDSARQSHFECRGCGESNANVSFTYSFQLSGGSNPDPCCCSHDPSSKNYKPPTSQVSQSEDHITVIGPPGCVCPDACTVAWAEKHSKFRSAKCLYLWKCGHRTIYIQ